MSSDTKNVTNLWSPILIFNSRKKKTLVQLIVQNIIRQCKLNMTYGLLFFFVWTNCYLKLVYIKIKYHSLFTFIDNYCKAYIIHLSCTTFISGRRKNLVQNSHSSYSTHHLSLNTSS